MSDGIHDLGEASVAAVAQRRRAVAVIDDKDARTVAHTNGCAVHGSLWMMCRSISAEVVDRTTVSNFADTVLAAGARWPFEPQGFVPWSIRNGLLDQL